MRREEFQKCCQAVEEGDEIILENTASHERGKILYCTGDEFQVKVEDKREAWVPENCEESISSSESPHKNL
jgi:hypothetical protein